MCPFLQRKVNSMEQHAEKEQTTRQANARDLGTIGGGPVTDKGFSIGGMAATDSDVQEACAEEKKTLEEAEKHAERNGAVQPEEAMRRSPGGENAMHQPQQGNIGGRNPGQSSKEIGDMDRPRGHDAGETASDPMTSRVPGKVNDKQ